MKYNYSLNVGDIVEVYLENEDGDRVLECRAKLIEPLESWYIPEPFPFIEVKGRQSINVQAEKWRVAVVSDLPFDNGRVLSRWILKYHSKGTIKIKEKPPISDTNDMDGIRREISLKDESDIF